MEHIRELLECFPDSFINNKMEFISKEKSQCFFCLLNCENKRDVELNVVQFLSRGYKEGSYSKKHMLIKHQKYMVDGINSYIGTEYKYDGFEIKLIYKYLGNGINKELAKKFVDSRFDMNVLVDFDKKGEKENGIN